MDPENYESARKKDILNHCPLLKSTLTKSISGEYYRREYEKISTEYINDMENKIEGSINGPIAAHVSTLEQFDLFNFIDESALYGMVQNLLLFGYELGARDQIDLFYIDIISNLKDESFLKESTDVFDPNITKLVKSILINGANIHASIGPFINKATVGSELLSNSTEMTPNDTDKISGGKLN